MAVASAVTAITALLRLLTARSLALVSARRARDTLVQSLVCASLSHGQASTSSRIERYLGFLARLSGSERVDRHA